MGKARGGPSAETVAWASPVGLTPGSIAAGKGKKDVGGASSGCGAEVDAFLTWCSKNGVKLPKCRIAVLQNTGRCVLASAAIAKDEVVVEVPDDAVLMAENCGIAGQLEECGLVKPADDPILEVQGIVLATMYERNLGAKSKWAAYLDFFPRAMPHMPMNWEEEALTQLEGTAALDKMRGEVQQPADAPTRVDDLWTEVAESFARENPKLKIPMGEKGRQLYRWATAVVSSYSFMLGDDRYQGLVPVWDALNHVTGRANVRLNHDEERGVLQMLATRDIAGVWGVLQMLATRDIATGEELVNNYGELSNAELLRAYGYVERLPTAGGAQDGAAAGTSAGSGGGGGSGGSGSGSSKELDQLRSRLSATGVPGNVHSHVQVPLSFVADACAERSSGSGARAAGLPPKRARGATDDDARGGGAGKQPKARAGAAVAAAEEAQEEVGGLSDTLSHSLTLMAAVPRPDLGVRAFFLRRYRLLRATGVFKIYHDRPPPPALTECLRLLSQPADAFAAAAIAAEAWEPGQPTPPELLPAGAAAAAAAAAGAPGGAKGRRGAGAGSSSKGGGAAGAPTGQAAAAGESLVECYQRLADAMAARYSCALDSDLALLSEPAALRALPPATQAAIVARADEKACWEVLKAAMVARTDEKACWQVFQAWLRLPTAADELVRQCVDVWGPERLAHERAPGDGGDSDDGEDGDSEDEGEDDEGEDKSEDEGEDESGVEGADDEGENEGTEDEEMAVAEWEDTSSEGDDDDEEGQGEGEEQEDGGDTRGKPSVKERRPPVSRPAAAPAAFSFNFAV
ncbi:hypothetical protein FOA52_012414 [Chlamydomonas sp. UWO 241]|nr:hypothetical protein FOA52_012414 [Chlamydomonas sp. UWO 241]